MTQTENNIGRRKSETIEDIDKQKAFILSEQKPNENSLDQLMYKNMVTINLETPDPGKDFQFQLQDPSSLKSSKLESSERSEEKTKKTQGWKRFLGLGLGLAASLAFSLAMLTVKLLSHYHPGTIGVWRFAGIFIPSLPLILFYRLGMKKPVFDPIWPINQPGKLKMAIALLLRGILGCAAIILQYYAITFMELADATVISFSTPVFVSIVARIFLGEKCGVLPVITAFLTLIGVVIIARPPLITGQQQFDEQILIGTILSFSSMIFATIVFVILRYLREVHFALVTSTFGMIGMIECGILCIIVSRFEFPHSAFDWFLGLSLAILTFIGQSLMTIAFKFEDAGPLALTRTMDVIFAFIWQFIFLGVYPDLFSLIGSTIVISAVVLIGIRKGLSSLPEDSGTRRKYWFFLK